MDISDLLDYQELLVDAIIQSPRWPRLIRSDVENPETVALGQLPVAVYPVFLPDIVDAATEQLNIVTLSLWRADDSGFMRLIVRDAQRLDAISVAEINNIAKTAAFVYVLGPGYGILRDDAAVFPEFLTAR